MKKLIAGALGECVHVAGVSNFLRLAEAAGWDSIFLGPAVPIEKMLEVARLEKADLVGVSYRLTPDNGEQLLAAFAEEADDLRDSGVRFVFGGTPPVAERARSMGFFDHCFDGTESPDQVVAYLRGGNADGNSETDYPQTTVERINWKSPFPLLRHHFGQPTMAATTRGIEKIAEAGALDVISLGTDQDAQANFFHPKRQDPRRRGAGGVPVRSPEDFRTLYRASRNGNYPLLRTYTGTDDFIRLAEMYVETISIAWAAIPLFWFNRMDGRGPWDLEGSICEHQKLMVWYGKRNTPVELNEPHHWGMRDAPDVVFVVSAYLAAYNARAYGVRDYITQMMFNSPPGLSDAMDLAKMLAVLEIIAGLEGPDFRIWRETRTGLLSYPVDKDAARAHLAANVYLQMALKPHIVHVVGYTEADHAATAAELIESCKLARRAIENALHGLPDPTQDPIVQVRKEELVQEARLTLDAILALAPATVADPLADAVTLTQAVHMGILDAPQLGNNPHGRGEVITRIDARRACVAVDPVSDQPIDEATRLATLLPSPASTLLLNNLIDIKPRRFFMSIQPIRYTVIGAGHGGKAMAAHLALMGFEVALYNRTPEQIAAIKARGGITLGSYEAGPHGFGHLACVTSNMEEALQDSDVVMVVVPASAHRDIARSAAAHLRDGQIVLLNPGRTLGALEFRKVLDDHGCTANIILAEAQSFIYASRSEGPAQARIFRIKDAVPLAALPALGTGKVLEAISSAYPQFIDGINVLETSINNIGAIFHPAISLLNAGWIESSGGNFQFYLDGVTPTVARIVEVLDRERVTIASALGIRAVTAFDWLRMAYNTRGDNLYEAIHNQPGYRGINAPPTLKHRYLTEDIPTSLVTFASLARRYGVSVRCMDSIIRLACIAHGIDYWHHGRTLDRLGIEHLGVSELLNYVNIGNIKDATSKKSMITRPYANAYQNL